MKLFKRQSKRKVIHLLKEEIRELNDMKVMLKDVRENVETIQLDIDELLNHTQYMSLFLEEAKGVLKEMRKEGEN
ncbi:hypothetical protein [Bacillus weihaiensis]|uniref:Uncharacterized protein n=1 Tax=Bacillus weihaiensis TaxID=1547283 RepID=A0A1L3MU42_9BACI|nr:hypothetical protein [Bacillus weihaiensis]APH05852.1 hypothetical protein A9C19_14530 [Bacillus weihaiensis]